MNEHIQNEQKNETMGENSFMKKLMKKRLNQKGLTLIELLAVIVILAIVAAIAVPAISGLIENSRYNAVKADATSILNASQIYFTENPDDKYVSVGYLKGQGYLENSGKFTDAATTTKVAQNAAPSSGAFVEKVSGGNKFNSGSITYSGNRTITFTGATLVAINGDTFKGSTNSDKVIKETVATNTETNK